MNDKVKQILEVGDRWYKKSTLTAQEKKMILEEYKNHSGQRLEENCGPCFVKAYEYFLNQNKPKTKPMKKQFSLKANKQLHAHGMMHVITEGNLTDELALQMLKKTPSSIDKFETFPDNWRELADKFDPLEHARTDRKKEGSKKKDTARQQREPDADDEKLDATAEKKKMFESKSLEELKDFASSLEYDAKEYSKLKTVPKMVEYLMKKGEPTEK